MPPNPPPHEPIQFGGNRGMMSAKFTQGYGLMELPFFAAESQFGFC